MINQKDISTWNTGDVTNWLKSINMNQYISKFESNKINGYDLIYLTKEDLKSLGIVSIHDKNIILNSMKDALLQQLKLNINFKEKSVTIQLDFDPNYTVEQLTNALKLIFKPISSLFLVTNNNEILMPNLKIIDLILYNPKVYKNFKLVLDSQLISTNNAYTNTNKDYLSKDYLNKDYLNKDYLNKDFNKDFSNNNEILNNNISINKTTNINNKNPYEKYYKINIDNNDFNTDNNNTASLKNINENNKNKNDKYTNNFITLDNNDINKKNLEKKENKYKYISNTNINTTNINTNINTNTNNNTANTNNNNNNEIKFKNDEKLYNRYKTYEDYNKKNDLNNNNYFNDIENKDRNNYDKLKIKKSINNQNNYHSIRENNIDKEYISNNNNNNNLYEYNRNITPNQNDVKRIKTATTYRKKYSIENGELNFEDYKDRNKINNNFNYGMPDKDDDDNQKFSSEKRNFRTSEFNVRDNYDNNNNIFLNKNYNYKNGMNDTNNYNINSLIGNKEKNNERMSNTVGFNEHLKYNNINNLSLNYNKIEEQK